MQTTKILSSLAILSLALPLTFATSPDKPVLEQLKESNPAAVSFSNIAMDAQTLTVGSDVKPETLDRGGYSATTIEEVKAIQKKRADAEAKKKAEAEKKRQAEEAAERERLRVEAQKYIPAATKWRFVNQKNPKCNSNVCWPVTDFTYNPVRNGFQTASRPNHNGFDMLAPAKTPIHATIDGTVVTSSESHYDFGAAVAVESVVDGKKVLMTYGHMSYGTRQVSVGQKVKAGQILGGVGSTGRSTANHLHLEIRVNGVRVDPQVWIETHINK